MKAAVLTGPRKIEIREVPEPKLTEDGIIMAVKACGICGSDIRRWAEGPPENSRGIIQGHEATGVAVEIGKKAKGYSAGDRLAIAPDIHCGKCHYCKKNLFNLCDSLRLIGITPGYDGALAEKILLTGEILRNGIVNRMPENIDFVEAALSEPCASVLASHDRAGTAKGSIVAVMGAGPIGCLHAVVAKALGATVIVSEPDEKRRAMAGKFKPALIVDPVNEDLKANVLKLSDNLGADIVICANPVAATQKQAVEIVRKAGRVVLFGGLPKANPMTSLDANKIHYGEVTVSGSFSYHPSFHKSALEMISKKQIPADLLITHRYKLAQVNKAFESAGGKEGLKVVIEGGA